LTTKYRIISFDGGGARGLFPVTFLSNLENRYPSQRLISLYSGTSTGSILAASLALGIELPEIEEFYKNLSQAIFKKRRLWRSYIGAGSMFQSKVLKEALLSTPLKGKKLCDCRTSLLIPSVNAQTNQLIMFSSDDQEQAKERARNNLNSSPIVVQRHNSIAPARHQTQFALIL
jgi:patatin-like phospholipase/acyl hydrolase